MKQIELIETDPDRCWVCEHYDHDGKNCGINCTRPFGWESCVGCEINESKTCDIYCPKIDSPRDTICAGGNFKRRTVK